MFENLKRYQELKPGRMFTRPANFFSEDDVYLKLVDGKAVLIKTGEYHDVPTEEDVDTGVVSVRNPH